MILQTSSTKLPKKALQDSVNFEQLHKLGIRGQRSQKGTTLLEKVSGKQPYQPLRESEVRRLKFETKLLK